MISNKNHRISFFLLLAALCFLLFNLTSGTLLASTDGEPTIQGDILTLSKQTLTVLVTQKTDSDYRPGETVIVQVNRNTRILNLQLQFISLGDLSPGDPVTVSPYASATGGVIADMIHLGRKK